MTLGFTDDAYNLATGTLNAFGALSDALVAEGFPPMVSRDGDRELADQIRFFVSRYRQQATGSGKYGDVRIWDGSKYGYPGGKRWVRVSAAGTVAAPADPPKSNHGKRRSNDLVAPYNANTAAHRRAKELAPKYDITCEGENFNEKWHWTYWGPLGQILDRNHSGGSAAATSKETEMDCMILINGKIYAIAPGFIKHCDSTAQVSEAKARGVKQYDYTGKDRLNQWVRALDFYGIPRDVLNNDGLVKNPENGAFKSGGLWTWARAVLAAVS